MQHDGPGGGQRRQEGLGSRRRVYRSRGRREPCRQRRRRVGKLYMLNRHAVGWNRRCRLGGGNHVVVGHPAEVRDGRCCGRS